MTLYELNKANYLNLPTLRKESLNESTILIKNFITKHLGGKYYMLLNNDLHYYTVFTYKSPLSTAEDMANELIDLAAELGDVKAIEVNDENDYIEVWIARDDDCDVYLFFNYDRGVITV